jgi:hypothetical protein
LRAELVPLPDGGGAVVYGLPQEIKRAMMLSNRTFLLEFSSEAGRTYYVQYSGNLIVWKTAQPAITGTGTRVQWIDNGQPKTESAPSTEGKRFYRVIMLP